MDQVHIRVLVVDFVSHFAELVYRWAERSQATVRNWPDLTPDRKADAASRTIAAGPTYDEVRSAGDRLSQPRRKRP
jgi:hypothetical protein